MIFKKKRIDFDSESLTLQTWRRFKRSKLSMLGLTIIFICCIISILGYLITPDKTPYANDQKPELHIKQPGFSSRFLIAKKNEPFEKSGFFKTMIFGAYDQHSAYTLYNYFFKGPFVLVEEFTGNRENKGTVTKYNIADVVYAIDSKSPIEYNAAKGELSF